MPLILAHIIIFMVLVLFKNGESYIMYVDHDRRLETVISTWRPWQVRELLSPAYNCIIMITLILPCTTILFTTLYYDVIITMSYM